MTKINQSISCYYASITLLFPKIGIETISLGKEIFADVTETTSLHKETTSSVKEISSIIKETSARVTETSTRVT